MPIPMRNTPARTLAAAAALAAVTLAAVAQTPQPLRTPDRSNPDTHRDTDHRPTVTVSGEGTVSVAPDRVIIRLGAQADAETAEAAQRQVNRNVKAATDAIRDLDVDGTVIQTTGLSLSPRYQQRDRRDQQPPRIVGYSASLTLRVTLDEVERAGDAIDAALDAGANRFQSITFDLQDDVEPRREALANAVGEAQRKAHTIASALGRRLDAIAEVTERGAVAWRPNPLNRSFAQSAQIVARDSSTAIEGGELELRAAVQITYFLR